LAKKAPVGMQAADFGVVFDRFQSSVSRYDCGKFCSPLNNGEPVCCSTDNAIPIVDKTEFQFLKSRTDLWHAYKPTDATSRQIVKELHKSCAAVECKGARFCERENRSMACRAFPFYPYFTAEGELVGLGTYWTFEDRCWLISNMQVVEREFVREFIAAYEYIFERDPEELKAMKSQSAYHRRTFSRRDEAIALIGREGGFFKVLPHSGRIVPLETDKLPRYGAYKSEAAYRRAVKEAGGDPSATEKLVMGAPAAKSARIAAAKVKAAG
jgi:hypothetical protein